MSADPTGTVVPTAEDVLETATDGGLHEVRLLGPPGTGKTTRLTEMITQSVVYRGADTVLVSSFTTAAAAELGGRRLPLPKGRIGTLHSHAYRHLERPPLTADRVYEFNDLHPAYALTTSSSRPRADGAGPDPDVPVEDWKGVTDADVLAAKAERLRNQLVPVDEWPPDVARFHGLWSAWKREEGLMDFTDLIETALHDTTRAPGDPQLIFGDEAQDNTPLELALYRRWGRHADKLVLAGDDDQSIYAFRGATPDGLIDGDPQQVIVLDRSYRVPRQVHAAAEMWVRRVTRRAEKVYRPRLLDAAAPDGGVVEGRAVASRATYEDSPRLVGLVEKYVAQGRSVMVLAACAYMLEPCKHVLRRVGMPFHNEYRRTRGDWNPLGGGAAGTVSSRERVLSYLIPDEVEFGAASRLWTGEDVRRWGEVVSAKDVFVRGAKQRMKDLPGRELSQDEFMALLRPDLPDDVVDRITKPDLAWLRENLVPSKVPQMSYPLTVAERRGGSALSAKPLVTIGTIHSVKGGQSDVVILIPDLSRRFNEEYERAGITRDTVIRQFYVGMTRAREELVVLSPATDAAIRPGRLLQGAKVAA